jgi:protein involved in polysaccharide export with SLBB domain
MLRSAWGVSSPNVLRSSLRALAGLLLSACLLSACLPRTGGNSQTLPNDPGPVPVDNTLGPGDLFEVRVFGEKELSNIYRVSDQGTIEFPLIGSVKVAGRVPPEVALEIRELLQKGEYLKNPQVTVFVKEVHSKKVFVFGQVHKPGTFAYELNMSVIQAITLAGGFNPLAAKNDTTVTRQIDGRKTKLRVRVEAIAEGSERNFVLKPGDIIFVPERFF